MARPGPPEAPLKGARAPLDDLAVNRRRGAVPERHVAEIVAGRPLPERGRHAGHARRGDAPGERVRDGGVGHL